MGDFLKELKLSEGRATGIPTIQEELKRNGSPKAIIETDKERSYFLIKIPCHPDFIQYDIINLPLNKEERIRNLLINTLNDTINETLNDTIKERLVKLISILDENPNTLKKDLALQLKISIPTVSRDLKFLTDLKILRREGAKKTGSWAVILEKNP